MAQTRRKKIDEWTGQEFKCIIAGCRDFNDYELLKQKCDHIFSKRQPTQIVSGGAPGVDTLALKYAEENRIGYKIFYAEWGKYGNAAGPIRNKQMAEYADALVAFWDGKSKGTKNMIMMAEKAGLRIRVVRI